MLTGCSHPPHLRPRIYTPYPGLVLIKPKRVISRIHEASEEKPRQKMLPAVSPGALIMPARKICSSITGCLGVPIHLQRFSGGGKPSPALRPYTSRQRKTLAMEQDLEARRGGTGLCVFPTANGASEELSATSVQQPDISKHSHESHFSHASGPSTRRT